MPSADEIAAAVAALRAGEVIGLPTETVYGLAADAANASAVARIFAIKGRPAHHPLIVHLADAAQARDWARDIPTSAEALMRAFWPGPLTLVLKRAPHVLPLVTGGQDTVALRVPSHPVAHAVLADFGGGVAAPSANRYGRVSPTTAGHVRDDLGSDVDLILDGGPSEVGLESTIVACLDPGVTVLRPGHISATQVARVVGAVSAPAADAPRVPGRVLSHYAPRTPVELVSPSQLLSRATTLTREGRRVAVLAPAVGAPPDGVVWRAAADDAARYGQELYAALRDLDAVQADVLLIARPPDVPAWAAVLDRLSRAAAI